MSGSGGKISLDAHAAALSPWLALAGPRRWLVFGVDPRVDALGVEARVGATEGSTEARTEGNTPIEWDDDSGRDDLAELRLSSNPSSPTPPSGCHDMVVACRYQNRGRLFLRTASLEVDFCMRHGDMSVGAAYL